jgi:hypothetical protein
MLDYLYVAICEPDSDYAMGHACTSNFLLVRSDPEAIYNFDFKNYVTKSCHKYNCNITLFETAFICM